MSPDTLEAIRFALQSVWETGGTRDEPALIEQSDLISISNLKAENAAMKEPTKAVIEHAELLGWGVVKSRAMTAMAKRLEGR